MRSKKRIILFSLLLGVIILAGLLVRVYFHYREFRENPAKLIEALPEGANIVLGEIRHTAVREGKKEWILEATSAHYSESSREAVFKDVKVTFFMDNGEKVNMEGQKGIINTDSNDMRVSGNVRVQKDDYALLTEMIEYNHKTRHIASQSPIRISGRDFELRADAMQIDLASEKAFFNGAVEGQIDAANQSLM
ncbi:MAG: LPS export ABC transporter periplasmic protein LptC [Desulfosarcina sp.]|nr:LPS export ABC transporter periplasmic protein LptC [Desulfobacterales bacterium]